MSHPFQSVPSAAVRRRLSSVAHQKPNVTAPFSSLTPMWVGIAGNSIDSNRFEIALAVHDGVYSTDFTSAVIGLGKNRASDIEAHVLLHVITTIRKFCAEHLSKFLGAGVTVALLREAPNLATRLWLDLDIVPIVFNIKQYHTDSVTRPNIKHRISSTTGSYVPSGAETPTVLINEQHLGPGQLLAPGAAGRLPIPRTLDEQADSAARKCIMYFGPNNNPRLTIGPRNQVTVDAAGKIHLIDDLAEYKKTVGDGTWNSVIKLADELREKKIKIGFFSSTPQGGGVALMRHALIRFLTALDVDAAWYVPNPSPTVFRTTKNNHNILQGVAPPELRLTQENKDRFDEWILKNGLRWTAEGGPLAEGGVDIAFIDDPQMPGLIPLIKRVRPELPIIYRSHIEIRSDLVHVAGSPQEEVWKYLWNNIQLADLFISHPVNKFVPSDVPIEKLALLGAATDWLDGLNKDLDPWDSSFYMGEFRNLCIREKMHELQWPARDYIVQVARFDPAKGIPNVLDSYAKFRGLLKANPDFADDEHPQLLICGHGAVDDPDASIIYDQVIQLIASNYSEYARDIVVMRLPPSDQLLNALMANARIALQLSTREGFEVKVSEAIHAGIPIVAAHTGGIPLQVEHGKSGFLTTPGAAGNESVAKYLFDLYTDEALYRRMSQYAKTHVSDEVGTVGNAAAWLYLAVMYTRGVKLTPNGAWLNDMLRAETNEPYAEDEPRLPRTPLQMQG
ncbi:trehalose phosphorylase [Mycena belliarum]|uniref:Trehalose phosphorylase n=1 Tax=Mycena belliarum TaxID=1033014 RepID=A0AAD6XTB1_9AGAR|nr:trehalose phosphorylase [Mycena belliae]